ncbi:hypothetical protein DFP91_3635 [Pseudorhodoplanes sinuspersici]|nr:hypothetical protein DFP91_3635 [Pseudorhodoplanes sinuspersici]
MLSIIVAGDGKKIHDLQTQNARVVRTRASSKDRTLAAYADSRPSGVYLSTAAGNSRDSRFSNSS